MKNQDKIIVRPAGTEPKIKIYTMVQGRTEAEAVAPLFPRELAGYLSADPAEAVLRIPGLRLLPYAGVDGKNRLLPVFRPDCVYAEGAKRHDLLVAVIPSLGGDGYNAII